MKRLCAVVLLLLVSLSALAQGKEVITHEKLWLMKRVGAPVLSPDGRQVVVAVTEPSYEKEKEVADLWLVPSDGSAEPKRLTSTKGGEGDVTFSPDGRRIAFTAKREGDEKNQVYVLDLSGGEAQRVTSAPLGARYPRWSPDGTKLFFMSSAWPGAADEEAVRQAEKERKERKANVRIFDGFPIRNWDRWLDELQTRLYVVDAAPGSKARDLLAGTKLIGEPGFSGAPGSGSDHLRPVWAPDSKSIVFVAMTNRNVAAYDSPTTHLYEVPVGGGEPRALTSGKADYSSPQFSPDGRQLCFSTSDESRRIYSLNRIGCASWPWKNDTRIVTAATDRSVGDWEFSPDGRTIWFTAEDSGLVKIYRVPAAGGAVSLAFEPAGGVYSGLEIGGDAKRPVMVAHWGSSVQPNEVVLVDPAKGTHRFLTRFTVDEAAAIDWRPPVHFDFTNADGQTIHSMLVLPPKFDESKKYPLFVLIHGGAHNMWRDSITLRWNYHLLGSPGYVMLLTDYRGSTGYGEEFALSIQGDPLRGPANDINAAADEAIRRFPFIDGSRQVAGGASYGGHLANWLEGTTTRYKALISHAGLASLESQWGTSDSVFHRELMIGGPPWEGHPTWHDQSPIMKAASFSTPMLLSVGEKDYRVPLNNALEMWTALQRQRVPSRLLVWPEENHWILNGENGKVFYREVHDWIAKWIDRH